jgi:hypothetical protein
MVGKVDCHGEAEIPFDPAHANDKITGCPSTGENTIHDANDGHRRAAEQHELAAQAHRIAAELNEKGITKLETGMRSAPPWSTRIMRTSWQRKPTASQGGS